MNHEHEKLMEMFRAECLLVGALRHIGNSTLERLRGVLAQMNRGETRLAQAMLNDVIEQLADNLKDK